MFVLRQLRNANVYSFIMSIFDIKNRVEWEGLIYIIYARNVVGEEERVVACDQEQLIDSKHPSAERGVEVVGLVVL